MRILLTGKNGQVGWELQRSLAPLGEVIALGSAEMNLADPQMIRQTLAEIRPDIIVNPAAYTAVDKAESEPELAMAVNGVAPAVLAEEAKRLNAALIHFSTDYVFDGAQAAPYRESDAPNPQSVYGKTKLAGENAICASGAKHLILRTSWVYGVYGGNFMKTMLRLGLERDELRVVADQFGAPTWARDLATATHTLLQQWQTKNFDDKLSGVYHLTAAGKTSWHAYAAEIFRLARLGDPALAQKSLSVLPISTAEFPTPAKRPANSVLSNEKIRQMFGIQLPNWQASLAICLEEMGMRTICIDRFSGISSASFLNLSS